MGSLSLNPYITTRNCKAPIYQGRSYNSGGIRLVGFAQLWRQRSLSIGRVMGRGRAVSGRNEGAFLESHGEEQQGRLLERGILLGEERDGNGSIVGFQLISQTGDDQKTGSNGQGNGKSGSALYPSRSDDLRTNGALHVEEEEGNKIGLVAELDRELKKGEYTTNNLELEQDNPPEDDESSHTKVTRNVVFVTSEAAPYSKTGGLGDVCGSLPIALAARGHRVMVVSPRYMHGTPADANYSGALDTTTRIKAFCFEGAQDVAFFHEYRNGVDWVFVDHPSYHRPGNPYGDVNGAFGDNQFRFTLLCHAACEAPLVLLLGGYNYGENCLFLVNDWHAGLVPILLAAKYRPYGVYKDARSVLVIHNLAHQGVEPAVTYGNLGLPDKWYGALEWVFPEWARKHALDKGEAVNILKGAIVTADRILTVSQGYSWEITTVEGGYGLHEILSDRKFVINGITNGINMEEWDPSSDEHIAAHYSSSDLSGKVECKIALQKELGLPIRPECPMIGFIGRLDWQKGVDMILSAVPDLMHQDDVQIVLLGSGDKKYEAWMRTLESTYKDRFRGWVGFSVPTSHRITAGCDIILMPSRFEPCGLNQLFAMRYGTVPVVHCTGGLRDTVETFNPFACEGTGAGTGWAFAPLTKDSMLSAIRTAVKTYKEHKTSWKGLMERGMERECSWDNAASQYEQVFEWAFIDPPYIR